MPARRTARHLVLAARAFRRRKDVSTIVTDAEHTGLPLALLLRLFGRRGVRHVMICHVLSTRRKAALVRRLGLGRTIDHVIVYSSVQKRLVEELPNIGPGKVSMLRFGVDERFYDVGPPVGECHVISAVGLEGRDYQTLIEAVAGLPHEVEIAPGSNWATAPRLAVGDLPVNVTVLPHLDADQLRELYHRSRFVVVPLQQSDFQAGVTTIVESMSTGRAVIYSRTKGQTDTVIDGQTGVPVVPGDADGLRQAMAALYADVERADRLGRQGRQRIESEYTLDRYVGAIGAIVESVSA
ncbi:MAG: glycosyltransferase family 4 protein [Acidimicrobiales bacterium]